MEAYDWSKFCRRIDINAPVDLVYKACSTQAGFEAWFLSLAEFTTAGNRLRRKHEAVQKGDTYRWQWYGYSTGMEEAGTVLEINGTNSIQFTFAKTCTVTITIAKEQGETVVTLWQENIPADDKSKATLHVACSTGWTFYLANLKSVLESNKDLRNKDELLQNVVNA